MDEASKMTKHIQKLTHLHLIWFAIIRVSPRAPAQVNKIIAFEELKTTCMSRTFDFTAWEFTRQIQ